MLKYRLVQRANPRDLSQPKKFYASPVLSGRKTAAHLSEDVASSSSLTRGDVHNTLMGISDQAPRYLLDGHSVQLGELGHLRITFSSDGVDREEDFDTSMIRDIKVTFVPSPRLKQLEREVRFEREK